MEKISLNIKITQTETLKQISKRQIKQFYIWSALWVSNACEKQHKASTYRVTKSLMPILGSIWKKKNPHNVNLAKRAYRNWNITIQDVNTGNVSSNKEGANSSKFQCHMWNSSIQQHSKCVKAICLLPYVVPLSWHSSAWALWNGTINLSLIQESRTNPMCFSLKKQCGFKGKVISKPVDYNTK